MMSDAATADRTQRTQSVLKSILDAAPSTNPVRSQAWQAFHSASDAASFKSAIKALPLDKDTQRQLFFLKFPSGYAATKPELRIVNNPDLKSYLSEVGVFNEAETRTKVGLSTDPSTREYAALRMAEPPKPKDAQPVAAAPPVVDPAYAEFDKRHVLELPNLATRQIPTGLGGAAPEVGAPNQAQQPPPQSESSFGITDWLKMSSGDRDAAGKVFTGLAGDTPEGQSAAEFARGEFSAYQDRQETPMIPLSKMFADVPASSGEEYFKRMAQAAESLTTPAATKMAAGLVAVPQLAAMKSVSLANTIYKGLISVGAATAGVQTARSTHAAVEKMMDGDTQGAAGEMGQATFEALMAALLLHARLNGFKRTEEWITKSGASGRTSAEPPAPPSGPPASGAKPPAKPAEPLNVPKSTMDEILAATEEALGGAPGGKPTTVSGPGIRTQAGDAKLAPSQQGKPTITLEKEPPSTLLADIVETSGQGKGASAKPPVTPTIDAILEASAKGVAEEIMAAIVAPTPAVAGGAASVARALVTKGKQTLAKAKGKVSPEVEKALETAVAEAEKVATVPAVVADAPKAAPPVTEPPRPTPDVVPAIPIPPIKGEKPKVEAAPVETPAEAMETLSPEDQADELDQLAAITRGAIADIQENPKILSDPDEIEAFETLLKQAQNRLSTNTEADAEVRDSLRSVLDDFNSMVTKRRPTVHASATTQINLPKETAQVFRNASATVEEADLVGKGRETEPHITVKYGLSGDGLDKVKEILAKTPPIAVKLGKTSLFEGEDQDVVKVDVDSPELTAVHEAIKGAVPNEETHPEYKPHVTVAYVKPGAGKKYAGQDFADGRTLTVDTITFNSEDGKATPIKLGGVKQAAMPGKTPPPPKDKEAPLPVKDAPVPTAEPPSAAASEKTPLAPKEGGSAAPVTEPKSAPQGSTFQQTVKQPVSVKEPPKPITPAKDAPKPEEPKVTGKPPAPAPAPKREPKKWELSPDEKKYPQDFRRIVSQLEEGDTLPVEGGGEVAVKKVEAFRMVPAWPPGAKGSREVTSVTLQMPDGSEKTLMGGDVSDQLFDVINGVSEEEPAKATATGPPKRGTAPEAFRRAKQDKHLSKMMRSESYGVLSLGDLIDRVIADGGWVESEDVPDPALRERLEKEFKRMDQGFNVPWGNPNHPKTIEAQALKDRLKGKVTSPEYRLYYGEQEPGVYTVISKTAYEYGLSVADAKLPAEPPKTASSEPPAPKTTTPAPKTEAAKDEPAKSSIPLTFLKTRNTKTGAPIFAVQLPKKYPDDVYDRLKNKATELGGYWSRFPASKGFHFKTEEAANKMMEAFGNTVPGKMAEPPKPMPTLPAAPPANARGDRKSPRLGTPERDELEQRVEALSSQIQEVDEKERAAKREVSNARYGSKKRDALQKKVERLADERQELEQGYEPLRQKRLLAIVEDAAESADAVTRILGEYKLAEINKVTGGGSYEKARQELKDALAGTIDRVIESGREEFGLPSDLEKEAAIKAKDEIPRRMLELPVMYMEPGRRDSELEGIVHGVRVRTYRAHVTAKIDDLENAGSYYNSKIKDAYTVKEMDRILDEAQKSDADTRERVRKAQEAKEAERKALQARLNASVVLAPDYIPPSNLPMKKIDDRGDNTSRAGRYSHEGQTYATNGRFAILADNVPSRDFAQEPKGVAAFGQRMGEWFGHLKTPESQPQTVKLIGVFSGDGDNKGTTYAVFSDGGVVDASYYNYVNKVAKLGKRGPLSWAKAQHNPELEAKSYAAYDNAGSPYAIVMPMKPEGVVLPSILQEIVDGSNPEPPKPLASKPDGEPPKPLSPKAERPTPDVPKKEEQSDATGSTIKAGEQGDAAQTSKQPARAEKPAETKAGGTVATGAPDRGALAGESAKGDEATGEVGTTRVGDGGVGHDAHSGDAQRDGKRADATGSVQPNQPNVHVPAGGERGSKSGSGSSPSGGSVTQTEPKTSAPKPPKQPDHVIKDEDGVGASGEKTRIRNNMAALRLLKSLEDEKRTDLTDDERKSLSLYSGWGGLRPMFFDGEYRNERREFEDLFGWQAYRDAQESTANANYTSPEVIKLHWDLMRQLGVKDGGRWLESAGGVGLYLGHQPLDMTIGAKRSAVELDPTSGKIMKLLYPNANVSIKGFEQAKFPRNFFDYAVTNVPFANVPINDKEYKKEPWMLKNTHNYFIGKNIDLVKPGGVVSVITTSSSLDSIEATKFREEMAKKADFIGAIRLPENTFSKNAGASVTTDVLVFRKRFPDEAPGGEKWVNVRVVDTPDGKMRVNEYFLDHPEMVMGELRADTRYGKPDSDSVSMPSVQGRFTEEAFREAMAQLPSNIFDADKQPEPPAEVLGVNEVMAAGETRDGGFVVRNGSIYVRQGETFVRRDSTPREVKVIQQYIVLRDALRDVHRVQLDPNSTDFELRRAQRDLKEQYDSFTKEFGYVNDPKNERVFEEDSESSGILALEHYTAWKERLPLQPGQKRAQFKEHVQVRLADVFTERVIPTRADEIKSGDPKEAVMSSMNLFGRIHWSKVEEATGMTQEQIIGALKGELFMDPEKNEWQPANQYLSGDVKEKLKVAANAAQIDPAFKPNVEALRAVIPEDRPIDGPGISITFGANWIPTDVYELFIKHITADENTPYWAKVKVRSSPETGYWSVEDEGLSSSVKSVRQWGTPRKNAVELVQLALNQKSPVVHDYDADGNKSKNVQATTEAQVKQEALRDEFARWVKSEYPDKARLQRLFNDRFNTTTEQEYDGSHLTLPGMSTAGLRGGWPDKHQLDAVARGVQEPSTLVAHPVGYGKTLVLVATAMEWRRLGLAKKPMMMVPNSLVAKTRAEIVERYPQARVLTVTSQDVRAGNREKVVARIATGNYDIVLMSDETFKRIPSSPEMIREYFDNELAEIDAALSEMAETEDLSAGRRGKIKVTVGDLIENPEEKIPRGASIAFRELVKHRRRVKVMLEKRIDQTEKDKGVTWERLGIDGIIVDEAHILKNLGFATKMSGVKGIQNSGNDLTADFAMKLAHIRKMSGGRNVVLATGTPVLNTMGELFVMMRYLIPDKLRELGVHHFDAWASTFGKVQRTRDLRVDNKGFKVSQRFSKFVNGRALIDLLRSFMDLPPPDTVKIPVPSLENGARTVIVCEGSDELAEYLGSLTDRMAAVDSGQVDKTEDNHLKITSDARKAAMDMRLIDPSLPAHPGSKAAKAVDKIHSIWEKTNPEKGTQLVFADLSIPNRNKQAKAEEVSNSENLSPEEAEEAWLEEGGGEEEIVVGKYSIYDDIRQGLIQRGIPANEIAFIHDYKTRADRIRLTAAMNKGQIRVLLGSTAKMGVGMNVQERLKALHHLDSPWRPGDHLQREGRLVRQGNSYDEVEIINYVTSNSFDAIMYDMIERKARFIGDLLSGRVALDEFDDVDDFVLSAKQMKLLAANNPLMDEWNEVDMKLMELGVLRRGFEDGRASLRMDVSQLPGSIKGMQAQVEGIKSVIERLEKEHPASDGEFRIQTMKGKDTETEFVKTKLDDQKITEVKTKAGDAILAKVKKMFESGQRDAVPVAMYRGVVVKARYDHDGARVKQKEGQPAFAPEFVHLSYADPETFGMLAGSETHSLSSESGLGLIQSIENRIKASYMERYVEDDKKKLESMKARLEAAKKELARSWERQEEYERLMERNLDLRKQLGLDDDQTTEEDDETPAKSPAEPPKPLDD